MPDYQREEEALRLIDAKGYLISGHDKNPIYPNKGKDWQVESLKMTVDSILPPYKAWGETVRGVGAVMHDSLVVLDFDPIEKTVDVEPEYYEDRRHWRAILAQRLLSVTYAENSRSGRGGHFVFRVSQSLAGHRGIEVLKKFYAIDFLTQGRYCDITGIRLNNIEPKRGEAWLTGLLSDVASKHEGSGSEGGFESNDSITNECLWELLQFVDVHPEDYSGWFSVFTAIYNQTNGSTVGLKFIHDWSRMKAPHKYNPENINYKWRTFKPKRYTYSIGTIMRLAREGGANVAEIRLRHRRVNKAADDAARTINWNI